MNDIKNISRRNFVRFAATGAAALMTAGLMGTAALAEEAASSEATDAQAAVAEQPTPTFQVAVYTFGDEKLHAFGTLDALGDVCHIVEGTDALVGIEMPAFTEDLDAWADYVAALGKPLAGVFTDNHATGTEYLEGVEIYATKNATDSQLTGSVATTVSGLVQTFGADFHSEVPTVTNTIEDGPVTVGGIDFTVIDDGDTYRLVIPSMNVVYTHMLGETTHSILASVDAIDAFEAQLEDYQAQGYGLVLSAHHMPEGQQAVATKIAYLEKAKELAASCGSAQEFIDAMNAAFPGYDGANYLEMSAGFLFPTQA